MDSILSHSDTGHRFAPVTADDTSGNLWISSILCLIYCLLALIVRLYIKWNLYGADDATITIATILQLGEVVSLFIAMRKGLGKSVHLLDASQMAAISKAIFAAELFLILGLTMAKASVAALMLRLFTRDISVTKKARYLCHATLVLTVTWAIASIIAIALPCTPPSLDRESSLRQCHDRLTRWRVIAAFDMFTELLLVLLPVIFIWPIQMKRYIKLQVFVAFGFRIPIIAFAAVHLHYVTDYTSSNNVSKAIIPALVFQQYELFWSLLSATIPTLKAFMRSFNSGFGMEIDLDTPYGYGSKGRDNGIYPLTTLRHATACNGTIITKTGGRARHGNVKEQDLTTSQSVSAMSSKSTGVIDVCNISPDTRSCLVKSHEERGTSIASGGSQEMIIRRGVE